MTELRDLLKTDLGSETVGIHHRLTTSFRQRINMLRVQKRKNKNKKLGIDKNVDIFQLSVSQYSSLNGNHGSHTNSDDFDFSPPTLQRQIGLGYLDDITQEPNYDLHIEERIYELEEQLNTYENVMSRFNAESDYVEERLTAVSRLTDELLQIRSYDRIYRSVFLLLSFFVGISLGVIMYFVVQIFEVSSSLNGNNGSHTNTDDLAEPHWGFQVRERERARREMRNNDHRRNPGGNRRAQYGPPVQDPPRLIRDREVVIDELEDNNPGTFFPRNEVRGPYYDGANYIEEVGDRIVDYGDINLCYSSGPGHIIVKPQIVGKPCVNNNSPTYEPCVIMMHVPGFGRLDEEGRHLRFPPKDYNVLSPLLKSLRLQFPANAPSERLSKAALAHANKRGPAKHPQLIKDTVQYFLMHMYYLESEIMGCKDMRTVVCNNGEQISFDDRGLENNIAIHLGRSDTYKPRQVGHNTVQHPEYQVRTDFDVILRSDQCLREGIKFRERFQPSQRYSTHYATLGGLDQPMFGYYDNNAINYNGAVKRVLGAKDDEDIKRRYSARLGVALEHELTRSGEEITRDWFGMRKVYNRPEYTYRKGVDHPDKLSASRGVSQMWNKLNGGRFNKKELESELEEIHEFVAYQVGKLVNRCNKSVLTKFVDTIANKTSWVYYTMFINMLEHFDAYIPRTAASLIPHIKGKLRRVMVNGRRLHTDDDILVKRLQACLKTEMTSFHKRARLFVSYGAGCMYASELPEYVKCCIDGTHVMSINGFTTVVWIMAKPKNGHLEAIFQRCREALNTPDSMFVGIYSDDSVYAGCSRVDGVVSSFGANVDISSCDSSQDTPTFLATYAALAGFHRERAEGLIEQVLLPIQFTNPDNPDDYFVVKFKGPFMGSGTVNTTIGNHIGSFMIAAAITYMVAFGMPFDEAAVRGSEIVGHTVTVDSWEQDGEFILEKAQFLKKDFDIVDEKIVIQQNMSCILRKMGIVDGDLTPTVLNLSPLVCERMTMEERFEARMSGVVRGWKNEPSSPIMDALRMRFNCTVVDEVVPDCIEHIFVDTNSRYATAERLEVNDTGDYSKYSTNNLQRRYGMSKTEILEIVEAIRDIRVGQIICTTGIAKMFSVDYGLP